MKINFRYLPFILLSILALFFGLWAGLLRIGWQLPAFLNLPDLHGPLMVCGFLGVLIPLERAAAIRQKWMFAVPLFNAAGWVTLFFAPAAGAAWILLGSLGTLGILGVMLKREPHLHTITMFLGALAWLMGNYLWFRGLPLFQVSAWWITFLVLTIGGERLELGRVLRPGRLQKWIFGLLICLLLMGAALFIFDQNTGSRIFGLALTGLSAWFLRFDLARRNLHHPAAVTRYIALCLFSGFCWLGAAGLIFLLKGALFAGPMYDAALHAVFAGFVMAMIFGHAPIIFPAILGRPIVFMRSFYLHLGLLHASLIIRMAGDLLGSPLARRWGGLLNETAILLFLGLTVYSLFRSAPAASGRQDNPPAPNAG